MEGDWSFYEGSLVPHLAIHNHKPLFWVLQIQLPVSVYIVQPLLPVFVSLSHKAFFLAGELQLKLVPQKFSHRFGLLLSKDLWVD